MKRLSLLSLFSSCWDPAVLGLISTLVVKPERCWASPEQFLRICCFFGVVPRHGEMKGGKKRQETVLLYKQAERKSKDWSLTAKQLNRKHVTISASRGEENEGGPDINIQGTWAQTVTGVLAIMNTFKLLWLWEEGQQLENVFTVTNFLYQSLDCRGGFTGIQLHNKVSQWGKPPTTTHKTHIIPVMLTQSVCLCDFKLAFFLKLGAWKSLCFCTKIDMDIYWTVCLTHLCWNLLRK